MTPLTDYLRQANEETVLLAQIESPHAVTQARAIAEVEGIDMLFFGPGDFSMMAGVPGQFDAEVVRNAMAETARQALAAGKRFGTLVANLTQARRALDLGASIVAYGGDMHFVRQAVIDMKRDFSELGIVFGATQAGISGVAAV